MEYCTNTFVLQILYILKILFNAIRIIIPLILIVLISIDFFEAITNDKDELSNVINKSIKRFIAAIIIFLIPIIIYAIFNLFGQDKGILLCINNATPETIEQYTNDKVYKLVENAKKTYNESDYSAALNSIYRLKSETEKNKLINELGNVKYAYDLKNEINKLKTEYTDEKYADLLKKINNVLHEEKRQELVMTLESSKKYYEENVSKEKPLALDVGTFERSDFDSEMRYIEVIPEGATTNMALVLYLHGIWSYASFSENAPDYYITNYVENGSAYKGEKFIFVVPRFVLSEGNDKGLVTWQTNQGKEQTKKLKKLIDFLTNKYGTDINRIIITGVSLGGDGTWNMVESYPNLFAAAVPISGCAGSDMNASNYAKTAIYAFHGTGYNEDAYKQCVPAAYDKIKGAGGNIKLEVKSGYSHGDMQKVYSDNNGEIFRWMLSQRKN